VGARQTLARQTAPTALAPVYHLTAWSPSRSSLWELLQPPGEGGGVPLLAPGEPGDHASGAATSTVQRTCRWGGIWIDCERVFGARMAVELVNDGSVTIVLEV
jgi:hypothetical protein